MNLKNLLPLIPIFLVGCGAKSAAGNYRVDVPSPGTGTVTEVGKLHLNADGTFTMNSGQLEMAGKWSQSGDVVKFTSTDAGAAMLSAKEFKIEEGKLRPQGPDGPQKHWLLVKE